VNVIRMSEEHSAAIASHLLKNQLEQAAFAFAVASERGSDLRLDLSDVYLAAAEDFEIHSAFHITLTDEALSQIIKRAWDTGTSIVEFHSHPDPRFAAAFSPSDLAGFSELVPHIRWRLRGRPYAAVVVAPRGFDALVWSGGSSYPQPLTALQVGTESRTPTGLTLKRLEWEHGRRSI
jgi:hypothetical protein